MTFAALKPGLLLGDGPAHTGDVEVADIGLDVARARIGEVTDDDVARWVPARARDAHKWRAAVWVVAGSPTMGGAAVLAARGALRAGASYLRCSTPGAAVVAGAPTEAVSAPLPVHGWERSVLEGAERFAALVVGPGLGRDPAVAESVRDLVAATSLPTVVDGDALWALAQTTGRDPLGAGVVLTPHDGEYRLLCGEAPGDDRVGAALRLAAARGAVVLLKGPTTVVSAPDGRVALVTAGDQRLATAGTGDVLAGMVGAFAACGAEPFEAAAAAAHVHGRAAGRLPGPGVIASDLPEQVPALLAELRPSGARP